MGSSSWLAQHKISVILGIATICFAIATIVLAVELGRANSDDEESGETTQSTTSTTPTTSHAPLEPWEAQPRIPPEIAPDAYEVMLWPDLDTGNFTGTVSLKFRMTQPRAWIPFHIKDLTIQKVELLNSKGNTVSIKDTFQVAMNEFYVVRSATQFPADVYTIKINFSGSLLGKIVGFYKSVYADSNGQRSIAASKFEPTDARAAFPCFDEPGLKATYSIKLVQPTGNGYHALSNMDVATKRDQRDGTTLVTFKKSVPMSTYLVVFIVSDFESLGVVNVDNGGKNLPIQVFSTPQQKKNTAFAQSVAQQVVKWYISYFNMPLPLPKLDLIGIPDFVSGAMENWGLITFRETALLFDAAVNSAANQKRVATVVSHETAHQWFGDLVTMAWWDDLWLNEGFASFMENKAVALGVAECKDWDLLGQAILDLQSVLLVDAALNSHPIVQTVSNPDQINQLFDSISYDKGSAVLTMLEDFLGEVPFKNGLQDYLKKHQLSNAASADLWNSLGLFAAPGVNVTSVMATWTQQMGFPVVNVKRTATTVELTQERFLLDRAATFDPNESPFQYKWDIPIRYFTSDDPVEKLAWLKRDMDKLTLNIASKVAFVKFNRKQVGYYRVNYEADQWEVFNQRFTNFAEAADRSHLLDDAFNLARSGYIKYDIPLKLVENLLKERQYLPWSTGVAALRSLRLLLSDTQTYPKFLEFEKNILTASYGAGPGQFTWNVGTNESHLERLRRVVFLEEACNAGVEQCLLDVGKLFQEWLDDPTKNLPSDLRVSVYMNGMKAVGGEKEWNALWKLYESETNAQEKVNFLRALACVNEPWLIKKYLDLAWSEDNVRSQDYTAVLGYIAVTPVGSTVLWDYYRSHWLDLVERFQLSNRQLGSAILSITSTFTTQLKLDELNAFYAKYPEAGAGSQARKNAAENIENRIKWAERSVQDIDNFLQTA